MIISTHTKMAVGGTNWFHYKNLGYENLKRGIQFVVPIEHLTMGSKAILSVKCDYCGKIMKRPYKSIIKQRGIVKKDSCMACAGKKTKESNLLVYGVDNVMNVENHRKSFEDSLISKFGTIYISSLPEIKKKVSEAWKRKTKKEIKDIAEKIKSTNMDRYGVSCPLVLESSREKLFDTLRRGSSQQKIVFDMLRKIYPSAELTYNKSYSTLSLDIFLCLNNVEIDIEYDSWYWHTPNRDRRRDEFLKSEGIKIFRIKSGKLIPRKESLKLSIDKLLFTNQTFSRITLKDWNEIGYKRKVERGGVI